MSDQGFSTKDNSRLLDDFGDKLDWAQARARARLEQQLEAALKRWSEDGSLEAPPPIPERPPTAYQVSATPPLPDRAPNAYRMKADEIQRYVHYYLAGWTYEEDQCVASMDAPYPVRERMTRPIVTINMQRPTSTPIGHIRFCSKHPQECRPVSADGSPYLQDPVAIKYTIAAINLRVNHAVDPVSDLDQYRTIEHWTYPTTGAGDCEDYMLEKMKQGRMAGLDPTQSFMFVVRDENGEGHAIHGDVVPGEGIYISDNKVPHDILPIEVVALKYHFVKAYDPQTARWYDTHTQTHIEIDIGSLPNRAIAPTTVATDHGFVPR